MPLAMVGPTPLPNVNFETWILRFDEHGACTSPATKSALLDRLRSVPDTRVILFSHGWNNEYEDATALYSAFLRHLDAHLTQEPLGGARPIFVGVIWPSTWLSWDTGPRIAASPGGPADERAQRLREELATNLPDLAERERLYTLLDLPRLTEEEAGELAALISAALAHAGDPGGAEGQEATAPDRDVVLSGLKALQGLTPNEAEGEELPQGGTVGGGNAADPQAAGLLDYLDPRNVLRLASVYQMKDRAGTVGWNGVARLLEGILAATPAPLHAVGHSYGAKVVLSAVAGANLPRQVTSLLLLQPAVSHLCFAQDIPWRAGSGGYVTVPSRLQQRILTTYSAHDFPLHEVFHRALRRAADLGDLRVAAGDSAGEPPNAYAALGGYGPRRSAEELQNPIPSPGEALPSLQSPGVLGLDGTRDARINGHGNVATPTTTWLLRRQLAG